MLCISNRVNTTRKKKWRWVVDVYTFAEINKNKAMRASQQSQAKAFQNYGGDNFLFRNLRGMIGDNSLSYTKDLDSL
jgi:hypothetical protein